MNEVDREIKAIDEATEIAKESKAEELPLGHEFVAMALSPGECRQWIAWGGRTIACRASKAAHWKAR